MKNLRFAALAALLALSGVALASEPAVSEPADPAPAAEASPELSEAATRIQESELALEMARDGQFGRIKSRDMDKLESAHARIVELLTPVQSPSDLAPQQSQALALAQSEMDAILRPEEDDRKICKRVPNTGTRLGALECLTLAERRQRARASRNMVNDAQRGFCVPGEGTPCTFGGRGG